MGLEVNNLLRLGVRTKEKAERKQPAFGPMALLSGQILGSFGFAVFGLVIGMRSVFV